VSPTLSEVVSQAVDKLVAQYKDATADGKVTISDVFKLLQLAVVELVAVVNVLAVPGADKKQAVLDGIARIYSEVIAPLDIPGVPNWIEPVVDRVIGLGIQQIVGGLIDAAADQLNSVPPAGATP